jgi:hypothetical protein
MIDYKKQGKKNRASGKAFELRVRKDLESQGWIVFRNSNDCEQVSDDPEDGKGFIFKQAKTKWNPFTRAPMSIQSGFPDFICIKYFPGVMGYQPVVSNLFWVQFVECKINSYLSKEEKEKVEWIKTNLHIDIFVASKGEKRGVINYERV